MPMYQFLIVWIFEFIGILILLSGRSGMNYLRGVSRVAKVSVDYMVYSVLAILSRDNEQKRSYVIQTEDREGGIKCAHQDGDIESKVCGNGVACEGHWEAWGSCKGASGIGVQTRVFNITRPAEGDGATECEASVWELRRGATHHRSHRTKQKFNVGNNTIDPIGGVAHGIFTIGSS